ncbi:MAG: DNA polymerase Y family protein [Alphaproteobacteria bacterium]
MKRILSLWLPSLAVDRLRRSGAASSGSAAHGSGAKPTLGATPFVTIVAQHNRPTVLAVDPIAAMDGVQPNMALADARAVCPRLRAVPAAPDQDRALLEKIADWCDRYSPLVAIESYDGSGGGIWIDTTGCAHLFGGELPLLRDLSRRLARAGLVGRAAIADTPGAAWAAARYGGPRLAVVAAGAQRKTLAPFPVSALRLSPADTALLTRLGLPTIGALAAIPRAPLTRRFGVDVARRLDQAIGALPESLSPRRPVAPYEVRRAFAEPVGRPEDVAAGLSRLLQRLCARLAEASHGARALAFTLHRSDGTRAAVSIGTQLPSRDAWHLLRLFAPKLEQLDPDPGVDALVLAATEIAPFTGQQIALARTPKAGAAVGIGAERLSVDALIDRLSNRLGARRVTRFDLQPRHLLEARNRRVPALRSETVAACPASAPIDSLAPAPIWLPLRLLAQPVFVAAGSERERVPTTCEWQRRSLRIAAAEGPWRVLGCWWANDTSPERDYFAVRIDSGETLLLFNDLRHNGWFVQGVGT